MKTSYKPVKLGITTASFSEDASAAKNEGAESVRREGR